MSNISPRVPFLSVLTGMTLELATSCGIKNEQNMKQEWDLDDFISNARDTARRQRGSSAEMNMTCQATLKKFG